MGLEPTTFCMAKAGRRSHPFAPVRSNRLFAATSGRASERQRTRANVECSHCSHCDQCHIRRQRDPVSDYFYNDRGLLSIPPHIPAATGAWPVIPTSGAPAK